MPQRKNFLFVILTLFWVTNLFGEVKKTSLIAKESLSLELTQEGLDLLSEFAIEKVTNGIKKKRIDDINLNIPFVAKVQVEQIKLDLKIDKLKIIPHESGLKIILGLKNLHLAIGHFRVSNPIFPNVGMSCFNTSVEIGNNSIAPIEIDVDANVKDQYVKLDLNEFSFHLNRNQYVSFGPRECRGLFGMKDYITQYVIKEVLFNARTFLNVGTNLAFKGLFKQLEKKLNSFIKNKALPLSLPMLTDKLDSNIGAFVTPEKMTFNHGKIGVLVSVKLERTEEKGLGFEREEEKPNLELLKYFSVGIKTELINNLLTALFDSGGISEIELTEDMHEVIGALVDQSELANFLPDLEKIELDEDKLRLFVSLKGSPSLEISSSNELIFNVPHLSLKFKAKRNGEWSDYFTFILKLRTGLDINIRGEQLGLSLNLKKLNLEGEWAELYKPLDKTFYREDAEESFKSLVYMISSELEDSPLLGIPSFEVGDREITVRNFKVENNFLYIDIIPSN